jgi:hypothetical protein
MELLHVPVAGSQVPGAWHALCGSHTTRSLPAQSPAWQVSVRVHASPSLHGVPSVAGVFTHAPVAGSHVPAV